MEDEQGGQRAVTDLEAAIKEGCKLERCRTETEYRRKYARTLRMSPEEGFCVQFAALKKHKSANEVLLEWLRPHLEEAWREAAPHYDAQG